MVQKTHIAVIGAGPAGLTAALRLAQQGARVEVFEAGPEVGGMCRSLRMWDQTVDVGPHRFFSRDTRVNSLWLEMAGEDYRLVDRQTRIYYGGRFFDYPLRLANVLRQMPPLETACCVASYVRQKLSTATAETASSFESWVTARFGRRLFEAFFKTYSEKLWGLPCSELDADFAVQRIKSFSLGQAIKHALRLSRTTHTTLVDRFAYPTGGTGLIYERMAERVRQLGGTIALQSPVQEIIRRGRRVCGLRLSDGRLVRCDHLVSTMPLTHLVRGLDPVPSAVADAVSRLRFRNTILAYLRVAAPNPFPDQWVYVHAPELLTGRITNFRNWVPELYGSDPTAILALEYWCSDEDPLWREPDEQLVARARRELLATGLVSPSKVLDGRALRVRRSYPVYRLGYHAVLRPVIDFVSSFRNLWAIGRYGSFRYNNQDHSILMGLLAAENILEGAQHDLWAVNADHEYQESARPLPARRPALQPADGRRSAA
jgi:protoporphyrinogen oxidase